MDHIPVEQITRAQTGDGKALQEILLAITPNVMSFAGSILHDQEDIKDVTQNSLLQIIQYLENFKGEAKFSTWVYRITVNEAIKHYRRVIKKRKNTVDVDEVEISRDHNNFSPGELEQFRLEVEEVLKKMRSKKTIPFTMFFFYNLSLKEIAEILKIPVGTVKSRIAYTRQTLRNALIKKGYDKYSF
jgi:RNA polymerase sigma-70 factor (ECF subfamily)